MYSRFVLGETYYEQIILIPLLVPKACILVISKRKEIRLYLQTQEVFLPLEPLRLLLKWSISSLVKWNDTLGHDRECLFWIMHNTNLFTSDFGTKIVFSFLGLCAICSLGNSLPYTLEDTFNLILSWILDFPWGISLFTKNSLGFWSGRDTGNLN